jgi:predicted nucleic acid-binding Zn ribbon protein
MWRTCTKDGCNKQFKQGGTRATTWCPECKAAKKKQQHARWDEMRDESGQHVTEHRVWDRMGNLVHSNLHLTPKVCGFCEEEYLPRAIRDRYCSPCRTAGEATVAHRNDRDVGIALVKHESCHACGEKFWKLKENKTTVWCDDACKEMLREHQDCLFCGETITPDKRITARFCKKRRCSSAYETIENLRDDRDGKIPGRIHTPQSRFNVVKRMNPRREILDEFDPSKGVSS